MEHCQDEHTPTVAKMERREEEREGGDQRKKGMFSYKIEMYVRGSEENQDRDSGGFWLNDRE